MTYIMIACYIAIVILAVCRSFKLADKLVDVKGDMIWGELKDISVVLLPTTAGLGDILVWLSLELVNKISK